MGLYIAPRIDPTMAIEEVLTAWGTWRPESAAEDLLEGLNSRGWIIALDSPSRPEDDFLVRREWTEPDFVDDVFQVLATRLIAEGIEGEALASEVVTQLGKTTFVLTTVADTLEPVE